MGEWQDTQIEYRRLGVCAAHSPRSCVSMTGVTGHMCSTSTSMRSHVLSNLELEGWTQTPRKLFSGWRLCKWKDTWLMREDFYSHVTK